MIFDVSHKTLYSYAHSVAQSQHITHLTPRSTPWQVVRHHSLLVEPAPVLREERVDTFGNAVVLLNIERPHRELVLRARSRIETTPPVAVDFGLSAAWDNMGLDTKQSDEALDIETIQFRSPSRFTPISAAIADYATASFAPGRPVLDVAMDLTKRMFRDFKFDASATDVSTPIERVLRQRRGVCQDFAHLALACLRSHRVPSRYVSGYILTRPPPGQVKLQGADASHAWISVWSPQFGWRDFDPTNGVAVADEHITTAFGCDYHDVAPISGILLGGGEHVVNVAVDVSPVG